MFTIQQTKNNMATNHLKYMRDNIDNDARIIISYTQTKWATIYPIYSRIKYSTAMKIIQDLKLTDIPAYKDYCNHEIGAAMYIFKENLYKYQ